MNDINKQKFLAELGKLLTFMYEEDRQTALDMYGKMFDDADDEQSLLQFLVSPTRQAVVIARAYNSKERKLQVHAQSKDSPTDSGENYVPDFVRAIDQIQLSALQQEIVSPAVSVDQFSLFEDDSQPSVDMPEDESEELSFDPAVYGFGDDFAAIAGKAISDDAKEAYSDIVKDSSAEENGEADPADFFTSDFPLGDSNLPDSQEKMEKSALSEDEPPVPAENAEERPDAAYESEDETVRKPKVFLLILYILLAIPVSLIGLAILLIPTIFFLALSVVVICAGVVTLMASFSGFAVFADVLVMLGAAIIILALGLLFLWIFIWFIGGAIVGLFRGIINLGSRWCYKEVQAE